MCGRFTIVVSLEELMLHYLNYTPTNINYKPKFNVAPMQFVTAVIHDGEKNRLGELRWGLVPNWANDDKIGSKMINARAETLAEKPAFKNLIKRKRCLIPADGFYEWKTTGNKKQPYRILLKSGELFSFAGLYDTWMNENGEKLHTCTIITTTPNSLMAEIHTRMPVILRREDEALWAHPENKEKELLLNLLQPYEAEEMRAYPVSPAVGNVRNNSEELIKEI